MHETTATRSDIRSSTPSPAAWATNSSGNADSIDAIAASVSAGRYHDVSAHGAPAPSPQDPQTSRERLAWQIRSTRVLTHLLDFAVRGLPRIAWTVGAIGANLVGRCHCRTGVDRRGQFDRWCAAIGAVPKPEVVGYGGVTYLRAVAARFDGLVDVIVFADIQPDDEDAPDASHSSPEAGNANSPRWTWNTVTAAMGDAT